MSITFQQIESVDNGAQFYNADLHVHSFGASHDVKDSTMTPQAVIDEAVRLGIRILSITDHNTASNVEIALQHAEQYLGKILMLPGVEISTANGHLLCYFAPKRFENIRNLLAKINLQGQHGAQDSHTSMSMANVIREVELLEGIAIAAHIDRPKSGFETLASGYPNWKKDIVLSPGLYGLEFDDANNLIWFTEGDLSTSEGSERKKLLKTRHTLATTAGRPLFASVQGSDAHSLQHFVAARTAKSYTRLKLNELSYEAFKIALTDPEARVRAVAAVPNALPRILGMQTVGGFLDAETYHFSDNLNCFIGGRGTGKSSALHNLAYGLGIDDSLETHSNCPGTVVIYGEDANGIRYRYERVHGSKPLVKAREDGEITDVPKDAFHVEYYQQGELAEVAKNPLKTPDLLQKFLDRHILLDDLQSREVELIEILAQNSAQLIPLEGRSNQLPEKTRLLKDLNKKLEIAEAGKLKEIATLQARLANERSLANVIADVARQYNIGVDLNGFHQEYAAYADDAGILTGSTQSETELSKIQNAFIDINSFLEKTEKEINDRLKLSAAEINDALAALKGIQIQIEQQLNTKITELQKKGLTGNLAELTALIKTKSSLVEEIGRITGQKTQLEKLRKERKEYLDELSEVRKAITERRKAQLSSINANLAATIQDYIIYVHYEPKGIIAPFKEYMLLKMQGTYFQDNTAEVFCSKIFPAMLASWVLGHDCESIVKTTGIGEEWAKQICEKLCFYQELHLLEVMWKEPCPVITVRTKGANPRDIPVSQLSDGQKHTIMLTIAMLAESNIPLIIDQPEDDLDNAFIFSTVVKTLRQIKERRQVILVTHNANIAVLGDAEMLFPMKRSGDGGRTFDGGSIDKSETKAAVMNILEGGNIAFRRRQEIYGY